MSVTVIPERHPRAQSAATLDVVVPVYNEAGCLPELVRRLGTVRTSLLSDGVDLKAILVDDGSSDGSSAMLDQIGRENHWVEAIHLSRNFGHQLAVTAGLDAAGGQFVCIIDADLQDPPELIPAMLAQLRASGGDMVYGRRRTRQGESRFKLKTASLFYRLLRWTSGIDVPVDTGDFRIMTRRVVSALGDLPERHRLLRVMIPWAGFSGESFLYDRDERFAGETKYPLRKMLALASHAVFAFSTFPVRLVQGIGLALSGAACAMAGLLALAWATGLVSPNGFWWLGIGMLGQTGLVVTSVGIVGGYVFRIQDETKARPLYVRTDRPLPRVQTTHREPSDSSMRIEA